MEDDFGEKFQKKVVGKIQYSACRNKNNVNITVGLPCGYALRGDVLVNITNIKN